MEQQWTEKLEQTRAAMQSQLDRAQNELRTVQRRALELEIELATVTEAGTTAVRGHT